MTKEMYVLADEKLLTQLRELVRASDVVDVCMWDDHLALDVANAATAFAHSVKGVRAAARSEHSEFTELKYAVVRHAQIHGNEATISKLEAWVRALAKAELQEATA